MEEDYELWRIKMFGLQEVYEEEKENQEISIELRGIGELWGLKGD